MSDSHAFDFGKFIPGFDFLQKLATQRPASGGAASALGGWVAPTVSVDELDRRVKELKAVQFWLEQNTTAIKATVQALEVQKMTLATLQGMNLSMSDVAKAFTFSTGDAAAPTGAAAGQWPYASAVSAPAASPSAPEPPAVAPEPASASSRAKAKPAGEKAAAAPATAGIADPMQWWGALTQQFQQIAASALREAASTSAPTGTATPDAAAAPRARPSATKRPTSAKSASARKPAAKKAPASRTSAAARPATAPAKGSARAEAQGWPLPPPFKSR